MHEECRGILADRGLPRGGEMSDNGLRGVKKNLWPA